MRGKLIIFLYLFLLVGLSECGVSISEIGSDFFTNKSTFQISSIDSVTLRVTTILRDSLVTSNTGRLLVGHHHDSRLGSVTSQPAFQVGITAGVTLDKNSTEYVGLGFHLIKDKYFYYDTTQTQTISVYALTKQLTSSTGLYYNRTKFSIDNTAPLGTVTYLPRPLHTADSLDIPMDDVLGHQLMTMVSNLDPLLLSNAAFIKFFPGLAILPDTTATNSFIGFSPKSEMRLYYLDKSVAPAVVRHYSFPIGTNVFYNKIHSDRTGTNLAPLQKSNQEVSSALTDHEGYFQCGVGLAMRVEMPSLFTLRSTDQGFNTTRAILEIRPTKTSYEKNPLPKQLVMYYVDRQNNLISATTYGVGLVKDLEYGRNTLYQVDVTTFVNTQLQSVINNKNALLILQDDSNYRSTVNRLYLGDQKNPYTMDLKIFYVSLPNQQN